MLAVMLAGHTTRALVGLVAVVLAAIALTACGGSGKPSYCSSLNDLKTSVQDLKNVHLAQNGTGELKSALQKVDSNAQKLISSAKSGFSSQATAINNSLEALKKTVGELPSDPALVKQVPSQISALTNSVTTLVNDASSKCK